MEVNTRKSRSSKYRCIRIGGDLYKLEHEYYTTNLETIIEDEHHMGRWSGTSYRVGNGKRLNIITAYRVVQQKITLNNSMSTNAQQKILLQLRGIMEEKPRRQFIIDFINQFKEQCEDENVYTILMIDKKENVEYPERGGICELIQLCGLVDVYQHFHEDETEFPTHKNGSRVIDYIFGSTNILQYINRTGYVQFNECFESDHRAVFCDLSKLLFEDNTPNDNVERKRLVGTNCTNKEGTNYINQIYKHFKKITYFLRRNYCMKKSKGVKLLMT
jgi:hypothetical protein